MNNLRPDNVRKQRPRLHQQRGVALVISLLFLLVVTIISVAAARNSSMSVKQASNVRDQDNSLQSAEAALYAVLAMRGTADDPFTSGSVPRPFENTNPIYLELNDPNTPVTEVLLTRPEIECQRSQAGSGGNSVGLNKCDYYRIDAVHDLEGRARTETSLGVVSFRIKID